MYKTKSLVSRLSVDPRRRTRNRDRTIIRPLTICPAARSLFLLALLSMSMFLLLHWQSISNKLSLLSSLPACSDASSSSYSICTSSSTNKVNVDVNASEDVNASTKHTRKIIREQKLDLLLPIAAEVQEEAEEEQDDLLTSLGVKPRAFPLWQNGTRAIPCEKPEARWKHPSVQTRPATSGILYAKIPKTGSSTSSGVTLRIASRLAAKHNVTPLCKNRVQHSRVHVMRYRERDRSRSILWSMVRDPTSRAVSEFFHFQVSRLGVNATDTTFQEYVKNHSTDFQMNYLSLNNRKNRKFPILEINEILTSFDFIGVLERREETLVALQMILGLETADVMHLSVKRSGSFDDGRYEGRCSFIQKSYVTPNMKSYFASEKWQNTVRYDQLLYRTVNRSLDLTIEELGRTKFEENLHKLRETQKKLDQECLPTVRMPCNMPSVQHGDRPRPQKKTDCLYFDMGCGFECMDRVLERMEEEQDE